MPARNRTGVPEWLSPGDLTPVLSGVHHDQPVDGLFLPAGTGAANITSSRCDNSPERRFRCVRLSL